MHRAKGNRLTAGEQLSTFDRTHILNRHFMDEYGDEWSFCNLIGNDTLLTLMDRLFGPGRYSNAPAETCARSVDGSAIRDPVSFQPLRVHIDGIYHTTWPHFAVNFWVPLSPCGVGTRAPGLVVYPVEFHLVRKYLGAGSGDDFGSKVFSDTNRHPMYAVYPALEKLYAEHGIAPITPRFEVGDIMVFNSWIPHGTYWHRTMSRSRVSLEIRFEGDSWDPLPPVNVASDSLVS
ncbi:MAG: hypothetical protein KF774_06945 [Planctomyces sp.]|nr:hypothetical protein [Planctomyces sp.]